MGIFEGSLMDFLSSTLNLRINLFSRARQRESHLHQKNKTYDYTQLVSGSDYIFEPIDGELKGYMTGQGKGLKPGDYILLPDGSSFSRYQIEEIDYYSNPPDMWIGLLKQVQDCFNP